MQGAWSQEEKSAYKYFVLSGMYEVRVNTDCCTSISKCELGQFESSESGLSVVCFLTNKR